MIAKLKQMIKAIAMMSVKLGKELAVNKLNIFILQQ